MKGNDSSDRGRSNTMTHEEYRRAKLLLIDHFSEPRVFVSYRTDDLVLMEKLAQEVFVNIRTLLANRTQKQGE